MSWIFGYLSTSLSRPRREGLAAFHPEGTVYAGRQVYVAAGGPPATLRHGTYEEEPGAAGEGGWAVAGLGLRPGPDGPTFLDDAAWARLLAGNEPDLSPLDGHFVALRWTGQGADLYTDALGVRTIYLARLPDGVAFGTRPADLARLSGGAPALEALGSHWLTFNLLAPVSLVEGLIRLGPGGRARCTPDGFSYETRPWLPPEDAPSADLPGALRRVTQGPFPEGRLPSLGLSGGLDSRLLLALLYADGRIQTHSFGPADHPDVAVARRLAERCGVPHRHLHAPVPDADTCRHLLLEHMALTQAVSPASAVLGLRHYPALDRQGLFLIDGGFGEIARRQFFNRLLLRGRAALAAGDPAALRPYLRVHRADVFTREALALMHAGIDRQLRWLRDTLPPLDRVGPATFLDLLALQCRLPNFFGFEQNRLDGMIPNLMPFAQPSVLQAVFATPLAARRHGSLFRRLIRREAPALAQLPLVKGTQPYPFRLPPLAAPLWTRARALLRPAPPDPTRHRFLEALRPFALEAALDAPRHFPAYDARKLRTLVEGYYAGKEHLAGAVDWWLALEAWRQRLERD